MPTYDYKCNDCGHEMEAFQKMSDDLLKECPECGKETLQRMIGTGAGIIFKGGGFYETDYKRKDSAKGSGESGAKDSSKSSESKQGDSKKSESGTKD